MEPMDTPKKPGIMAKLRNRKGFSLIEMAIVLVIIGIIIGAIIKGQDLIANSQAKKVISAVSTWRNLTITFLDRNGRFPGDATKDGLIGNTAAAAAVAGPPYVAATLEEQTAATSAIAELATMETAPENPVVVGSTSFWVYIGSTATNTAGTRVDRNAILVCGSSNCATAFTKDQIELLKAMDTAFDGSADGGAGQFRAVTTAAVLTPAAPSLINNRMAAVFWGLAATGVEAFVDTTAGGAAPWTAGTTTSAVWLFDKPF